VDFYQRAAKFGHSRQRLDAGEAVRSTIIIPNIYALREFLDEGYTEAERLQLALELFGNIKPTNPETDGSASGILRRIEGYLYGNELLYEEDRVRTEALFPMHIETLSEKDATVNTVQNLGTGGAVEERNYGTLTLEPGGCFVIYNKPLVFHVETLIRNGGGTDKYSDFTIFGATGPEGGVGDTGGKGSDGDPGAKGTCKSPGVPGNAGGPGKTGGAGITGGTGKIGQTGGASLSATITISKSIQGSNPFINVSTRSGTGGKGGKGGRGGTGGVGGRGGDGESCGCDGTNAGNGGRGGTGGAGGRGGTGGNGIKAEGNIVVTVPAGFLDNVRKFEWPAPPGGGGDPGGGGPKGGGGGGGTGGGAGACPRHSGGTKGGDGSDGGSGVQGNGGSASGDAAQIIVKQL